MIINAAAYTAVDAAESDPEGARALNAGAPGNLAKVCGDSGVVLVHISTDYVYGGDKRSPYTESDPIAPISVYGQTKAEGDAAIQQAISDERGYVILRTSWVYSPFGANFVKTMLRLASERDTIRVVNDQTGSPTSAGDLARAAVAIASLAARNELHNGGVFHYTGSGTTTWNGFAEEIFKQAAELGLIASRPQVEPVPTSEYETPAARPLNSVLDCAKFDAAFPSIVRPRWQESLRATLEAISGPD